MSWVLKVSPKLSTLCSCAVAELAVATATTAARVQKETMMSFFGQGTVVDENCDKDFLLSTNMELAFAKA